MLTCDIKDDIVVLQGSLMVGVARQASIMHQARTDHYKNGQIGILDEKDCAKLIKIIKNL